MRVYTKALVKQLDEKDEEIANVLISLGMSRPIARVQ
jgi:predicted transcriptional regulator